MRRIVPFDPAHLRMMALHPRQMAEVGDREGMIERGRVLGLLGRAFTLFDADGRMLCCAGIMQVDPGSGYAWAFMSAHAGRHMMWLTRKIRRYLDEQMESHRRIEMTVTMDFEAAARWAWMLGFDQEGVARCAAPDGGDMIRFARVRPARTWRQAA